MMTDGETYELRAASEKLPASAVAMKAFNFNNMSILSGQDKGMVSHSMA
jgi:hypothetical protein